jgi:hypothetical protein
MAHHGHAVESRLPIKEDEVTVLEAPLNHHTLVDLLTNLLLRIREIEC